MERSLELCRQVYNRTLTEQKQAYEESGKTLSKYTLNKLLPQWKTENPEYKEVFSQTLQEVQDLLVRHYQKEDMNVVAVVLLWTGTTMQLSTFSDWDCNLLVLNP